MKFLSNKTRVLYVYNDTVAINSFSYTLNSETIEYTPSEKYLGILTVPTLSWSEHSNMLHSKANQRLGVSNRIVTLYKVSKNVRIYMLHNFVANSNTAQ